MSSKNTSKWYFGGLASAGAVCFTHPLDLIKVTLQTQQHGHLSVIQFPIQLIRTQGLTALYNGLSASLCRQITYSGARFGMYEVGKQYLAETGQNGVTTDLSFFHKIVLAGVTGAGGGIVGAPADLVNVRMQNDVKLPADQRRNYKHAVDGLWRVMRTEGVTTLFNGAQFAATRAVFMNIGQLAVYDEAKATLLSTGHFQDNALTHFLASLFDNHWTCSRRAL